MSQEKVMAPDSIMLSSEDGDMQIVGEVAKIMVKEESQLSKDDTKTNQSTVDEFSDLVIQPAEGTPAAEALAANAAIKISKVTKGLQKKWMRNRPNLNIVTQIKKHTKQTREKHFSRNFKGKVINGIHELYTLTMGMMLGIRCTVGHHELGEEDKLELNDFSHVEKRKFVPRGNSNPHYETPPHNLGHTFKFKTYSPKVFKRIRDFFGIDASNYMLSVCGNCNYLEFISNSKSGQFFFYSYDGKYMIKTQTKEENKFMKKILPYYFQYIAENPHTLLVRIVGMHRVAMYHLRRKVRFVIMTSVFDTPAKIHTIYDLKGSLIGRAATPTERATGGVLKDRDILTDGVKIHLGDKKASFMAQLQKDAEFLATLNIMDYSLLLGIHDRNSREADENNGAGAGRNSDLLNDGQHSNTPFRRYNTAAVQKSSNGTAESNGTLSPPSSPNTHPNAAAVDAAAGGPAVEKVLSQDYITLTLPLAELNLSRDSFFAAASLPSYSSAPSRDRDATTLTLWTALHEREGTSSPMSSPRRSRGPSKSSIEEVQRKEARQCLGREAMDEPWADAVGIVDYGDCYDIECDEEEDSDDGNSVLGAKTAIQQGFRQADTSRADSVKSYFDLLQQHIGTTANSSLSIRHVYGPDLTRIKPWSSRVDGGINSRVEGGRGDDIYFCGIIDILQQYNFHKRAENFFKGLYSDRAQISAVDAKFYAKRFIQFMNDNID